MRFSSLEIIKDMQNITKTCLIIEPVPPMRAAFRALLSRYSFEIGEAENGRDAIRACRRNMPDFILLNPAMPDMDGHEFMCNLRRIPQGHDAVILYCPASPDADDVAMAMQKGAGEYLVKPFDADMLDFKLRQIGALPPDGTRDMAA